MRNHKEAEALLTCTEQELEDLRKREIDLEILMRDGRRQHEELQSELESLRRRKSNIPSRVLQVRQEMAQVLKLPEEDLPFAGELLQVDEKARDWEGAMERLLHNFGLSLLVPEPLYAQVSYYVDRTNLQGRLVYYRVREGADAVRGTETDPRSLVRKLRIKPDSPFYDWLEHELTRRFDFICCDSVEEFRRLPNAVTRSGQVKSGGQRHEKDDRHGLLQDRRRFVLGWSNEQKIKALEASLTRLEGELRETAARIGRLMEEQRDLTDRRDTCRDLLQVKDFGEIHWQPLAMQIDALEREKREIEQGSDVLQSLRKQLEEIQRTLKAKDERREEYLQTRSRLEQQMEDRQGELGPARQEAGQLPASEVQTIFPLLERLHHEVLPDRPITLQNLSTCQTEVRGHLQRRFDGETARCQRVAGRLIQQMQAYKHEYPADTSETDASLDALDEYDKMLSALRTEDLPRHEAHFKKMLNEGTINSVALFQNQLDKERQSIEEKVRLINRSLREIEYNAGTYIELVIDRAQDQEIREFQQDLKQCLAHTLDQSDLYSEGKFLQVKKLIDRFNGREGLVDLDARWTVKVTDVRNWFIFSASERWQEDGSEKEFYSDSAGKSGGQKEKLAYTILASALAYQFGLEWGARKSRSFRFVVIDEAFGRGSDESTRYGLELFRKLNLQLLIVTPLQKIHIIEDYIRSVHFVHNQDGRNSMVRNLTLEEYREEKQRHLLEAAR